VDKRHEPTRILNLLPTTSTSAPSVEYIQHTSTTGAAAPVAAGAVMNEAVLTTSTLIATAQKLGIFTTLTDELIADFATFRSYVDTELSRLIVDSENNQLLNGNGTAPQLKGLLQTSGTLTRAKGTENIIDTLEMAIQDLRSGSSYCEPDALILAPSDWSLIRRTKASGTGAYLLGNPAESAVDTLWGIPVATTTQIAAGTGILANLGTAAQVFVREGITLEMTNSAGTDFQSGLVKVRATERLALAVVRPSAINVITGIA
jgi:HK97 family phage major capsid protein